MAFDLRPHRFGGCQRGGGTRQHINGVRAVVEATFADHLLHVAVLVEEQVAILSHQLYSFAIA